MTVTHPHTGVIFFKSFLSMTLFQLRNAMESAAIQHPERANGGEIEADDMMEILAQTPRLTTFFETQPSTFRMGDIMYVT